MAQGIPNGGTCGTRPVLARTMSDRGPARPGDIRQENRRVDPGERDGAEVSSEQRTRCRPGPELMSSTNRSPDLERWAAITALPSRGWHRARRRSRGASFHQDARLGRTGRWGGGGVSRRARFDDRCWAVRCAVPDGPAGSRPPRGCGPSGDHVCRGDEPDRKRRGERQPAEKEEG